MLKKGGGGKGWRKHRVSKGVEKGADKGVSDRNEGGVWRRGSVAGCCSHVARRDLNSAIPASD